MRGYQYVNSQVELLVANQERIVDVTLYNVRLGRCAGFCPVGNLVDFLEQKDALALAAADGLHNPHALVLGVALELL